MLMYKNIWLDINEVTEQKICSKWFGLFKDTTGQLKYLVTYKQKNYFPLKELLY